MNEPTQEQVEAAKRMGLSLHFADCPLTLARLVELVAELQQRIDAGVEEEMEVTMQMSCMRSTGVPFDGVTIHPMMHIVAEELGRAPARVESPKVVVVRKRPRPRPLNSLMTFNNEQVTDFMGRIIANLRRETDKAPHWTLRSLRSKRSLEGSGYKGVWQPALSLSARQFHRVDGNLWHANSNGDRSPAAITIGNWRCGTARRTAHAARADSIWTKAAAMTPHELLDEIAALKREFDAADRRSIPAAEFAVLRADWERRTAEIECAMQQLQHGAGSLH